MGFNDWIYITPASSPAERHPDEVNERVQQKVAKELEQRLRGRLDNGISDSSARRARSVRSAAEGGRIVIDQGDDPASGTTDEDEGRSTHARDLDDLFSLGSGIPSVGDGGVASFRTIDASALFGRTQQEQDEMVNHTVQEVLQLELVDMLDGAIREVDDAHPSERTK